MSMMPSLSIPISSTAKADDTNSQNLANTPVAVINGNQGADIVALINAASNLQRVQSEPVERQLDNMSGLSAYNSGGLNFGSIPSWVWLAAAGVLLIVVMRRGDR